VVLVTLYTFATAVTEREVNKISRAKVFNPLIIMLAPQFLNVFFIPVGFEVESIMKCGFLKDNANYNAPIL
jgi:hypothetical protein